MQHDVATSHHLSDSYLDEIVEVVCGISENCEGRDETITEEWRGFKCLRNGLRDIL